MSSTEFININPFDTLKTHNKKDNITNMPTLKMKETKAFREVVYFPNSLNPVFLTSKLIFQIEFQLTEQFFIVLLFLLCYLLLLELLALAVSSYSFKKISTDC